VKIIYTKHAEEKFIELEKTGRRITKAKIIQVIKNPKWKGVTRYS